MKIVGRHLEHVTTYTKGPRETISIIFLAVSIGFRVCFAVIFDILYDVKTFSRVSFPASISLHILFPTSVSEMVTMVLADLVCFFKDLLWLVSND